MTPRPWVIDACIAVLCLIWGSTWLVIKTGLRDLPPFWSAGIRFALAATVMTALVPVLARREGGGAPPWRLTLVMGTTSFATSYAIVYWSETVLPSGVVSVLWAVYPLMQAMAGHLFLPGERLSPRQWLGFVLGFLGVVVLFLTDLRSLGPSAAPAALVLMISPLVSTIGFTVAKRHGGQVSSLHLNRNAMAVGAAALLGLSILFEPTERGVWTPTALFSVGYLGIVGTVVTFGLYMWLLRYAPAHRLSVIAYLTPPIALTLGWAVAGEPLTVTLVVGTAFIVLGVSLAHRKW